MNRKIDKPRLFGYNNAKGCGFLLRILKKTYAYALRLWTALCRRLPLRKRVLFFTIRAEGRLLENAQCVYDALPARKVVFAHKHPMPARLRPYLRYLMLTSKVIVTDDYMPELRVVELREDQRVFQIWHAGGGFKKMGFDVFPEPDNIHAQYDDVTVTGEACRECFATAFRLPIERIHAYGLPRTDKLHDPVWFSKTRKAFFDRRPEYEGKTLYLYCPTFREEGRKRVRFDPKLDFDAIDKALSDDEALLLHMHPTVDYSLLDGKTYRHIADLTGEEDTLTLLCVATLLVTDYSSVIVEGSVLGLPMLFYCPDFETYERGFYLKYPDDLPGEMRTDGSRFVEDMRDALANRSVERERNYRRAQTDACDGRATERVVKVIEKWLSA